MSEPDAYVLQFAGFLGHEFVVTEDAPNGARRLSAECNTHASAMKCATGIRPRIFRRNDAGDWVPALGPLSTIHTKKIGAKK